MRVYKLYLLTYLLEDHIRLALVGSAMTETLPPTTDRAADDVSDATAIFRGNLINSSDQLAGINTKSFRCVGTDVGGMRFLICVHAVEDDVFVSGSFVVGSYFEHPGRRALRSPPAALLSGRRSRGPRRQHRHVRAPGRPTDRRRGRRAILRVDGSTVRVSSSGWRADERQPGDERRLRPALGVRSRLPPSQHWRNLSDDADQLDGLSAWPLHLDHPARRPTTADSPS